MLFGYTTTQWEQFYRLYKYEKAQEPESLFDLLNFWKKQTIHDPEDCFKIASRYSEALNVITDTSAILEMIKRFMINNQGTPQ